MPKDLVERAQMFAPYDALRGFSDLIRQQEVVKVKERHLSEDEYELLNRQVYKIKVGMMIQIIYYKNHQYIQVEGLVSKFNLDTKMIQIVKTKINIKDIVEIHFL